MAEYIEREAIQKRLNRIVEVNNLRTDLAWFTPYGVNALIEEIPAADVRPVVRWTLCEDKQPPTGRYLVLKKYFGGDFGYDVCSYAEDLSKIDKYDFPKRQYKGIGGWFDYDSETGYFQTSVYAWMPLPTAPWFGAKMEEN